VRTDPAQKDLEDEEEREARDKVDEEGDVEDVVARVKL